MVLVRGLTLAAIGVAFGVLAAIGLSRVMESLVFGVAAVDVATYVATALTLVGVAGLASYLPARKAATVDPTSVLRHE